MAEAAHAADAKTLYAETYVTANLWGEICVAAFANIWGGSQFVPQ